MSLKALGTMKIPPSCSSPLPSRNNSRSPVLQQLSDLEESPRYWEHDCNGYEFSTFNDLVAHQRENSGTATNVSAKREASASSVQEGVIKRDPDDATEEEDSLLESSGVPLAKKIRRVPPWEPTNENGLQTEPDAADLLGSSEVPLARRIKISWSPIEEQRLKNMRDAGNSWSEIAKVCEEIGFLSLTKAYRRFLHGLRVVSRNIGIRYDAFRIDGNR